MANFRFLKTSAISKAIMKVSNYTNTRFPQGHTMTIIANNIIISKRMKDLPKLVLIKDDLKAHLTTTTQIIIQKQIEEPTNQDNSLMSIGDRLIEDPVVKINK
jgi:hypothetical protein